MRSQIVTLPTRDMAQYALSKEALLATGNAEHGDWGVTRTTLCRRR